MVARTATTARVIGSIDGGTNLTSGIAIMSEHGFLMRAGKHPRSKNLSTQLQKRGTSDIVC